MLNTVKKTISRYNLFSAGDTVIVAVSGGADSVALLDFLAVTGKYQLNLIVAHLNHCLRGKESDDDESFVRCLASSYGLNMESRRVDVSELSRNYRMSLEQAGRKARYDFFCELLHRFNARTIALAHHADDQAETVLLRLLRGAATTGLSAMAPFSSGRYVRPLLEVTRSEIEYYCKYRKLSYRTDSSNMDIKYLRNRIRHELLPILSQYNPAIADRLVSTATALNADEILLESITDKYFSRYAIMQDETVQFCLADIKNEPSGLRMRLYRRAIQEIAGDLARIGSRHLQAIDDVVMGVKPNLKLALPDSLALMRHYDKLFFQYSRTVDQSIIVDLLIDGPGSYPFGDVGIITIDKVPIPSSLENIPATIAYFNPEQTPFPWMVRAFRQGDRFAPFGLGGSKKLKNFFIDNKVPREHRRLIPLLFCGPRLLWVCGMRLGDDPAVRLTENIVWRVNFDVFCA